MIMKQICLALLISFFLVMGLYFATVRYKESYYGMPFGETQILYVYQNVGTHQYHASGPFTSTYTRTYQAEGCPCYGLAKPFVVFPMLFTWQLVANVGVWSLPVFGVMHLREKHAHTRHLQTRKKRQRHE